MQWGGCRAAREEGDKWLPCCGHIIHPEGDPAPCSRAPAASTEAIQTHLSFCLRSRGLCYTACYNDCVCNTKWSGSTMTRSLWLIKQNFPGLFR